MNEYADNAPDERGRNIDHYVLDVNYVDGEPELVVAELVPEPPKTRRLWFPLGLFIATCLSTWFAGIIWHASPAAVENGINYRILLLDGLKYAVPVMTILICHEMGHFLQAKRWGVHASFPYFIPMPVSPLGTLGAVIAMEAHKGDRKALFDIGITGPLAGLVPTIIFCILGLYWSEVKSPVNTEATWQLGEPLIMKMLIHSMLEVPPGKEVFLHPVAFAGWVGLLITAINLIPVGQLDGGHVLYSLLRTRAHTVALTLLWCAVGLVALFGMMQWLFMLILLIVMGPKHPPTADDSVPLGTFRTILGWATLAFIPFGFTAFPFMPPP